MSKLFYTLLNMKKELLECSLNKDELLKNGIDLKLARVEERYAHIVELNCDYILSRSNYKTWKALDRFNKMKEKDGNENKSNRGFIEII